MSQVNVNDQYFNMSDDELTLSACENIEKDFKNQCGLCGIKFDEQSTLDSHLETCKAVPSTSSGK